MHFFQEEALPPSFRYELKLASDSVSAAQARSWIRLHPEGFRQAYASRLVNNLYFDTVDLQAFNDNLSGISRRQKLRLRWYGSQAVNQITDPILELKVKENMLGAKKQQPLNLTLDFTKPFKQLWQAILSQADESWVPYLLTLTQPSLINCYQREYYVSPDSAVRATLDYEMVAYEQRMTSRPNLNRKLPLPAAVVIEVKAAPEHFERLQRVMSCFPIQRSRSSKYVNGLLEGPF